MNRKINLGSSDAVPFTDDDVYGAMQELGGYYDITLEDFRTIYQHAYRLLRQRMFHAITARKLMSSPARCVPESMPLTEAVAFLAEHGFSGVPVTDDRGTLCGVLSEADIARALGCSGRPSLMGLLRAALASNHVDENLHATVRDVMTRNPISITPETNILEISTLIQTHSINRLPVLENGTLVGIVSRTDVINGFGIL